MADDELRRVWTAALSAEGVNLAALLRTIEALFIRRALALTGQDKAAAARLLGMKRTTLVEKIRRSRQGEPPFEPPTAAPRGRR